MPSRLSVRLLHGIEPFEFDARIRCTELPIDDADSLVAMILPALIRRQQREQEVIMALFREKNRT